MLRVRLKAGLAACMVCGCAFAGGLLANGAASDKAAVGGGLVAVAGAALAALVYFARRRVSGPNQALQQTAGHDSFLGLHSSPVPRRC